MTPRRLRRAAALAPLALASACVGAIESGAGSDPAFVEGGTATAPPQTVLIDASFRTADGGRAIARCSGTLIGPQTVLTVAQCVTPSVAWDVTELESVAVRSPWVPEQIVPASAIVRHPSVPSVFDPATLPLAGFDVAVLALPEAVTAIPGTGAWLRLADEPPSPLPAELRVAGRTRDGVAVEEPVAAPTTVARVDSHYLWVRESGFVIESGDGGGPVYTIADGRHVLHGLAVGRGHYARLDPPAIRDWVLATSAGIEAADGPTEALCASRDGDLDACDATPGCAYYTCREECHLRGTTNVCAPAPACTPFRAGLRIDRDTVLCPGSHPVAVAPGAAALEIAASGVTLTCDGTELVGTGGMGTVAQPTVGIEIASVDGVTVRGCAVHGFRYGVVATDAVEVTLEGLDLDDNFHAPEAGWVQDTVQGGGVRLERVQGGRVAASRFARTWNGIELRSTRAVEVVGNVADHCSNTGATLVDAHDNVVADNDFSWAIRGDGLSYPSSWYGVDTRDSSGIILDAGSSGNSILRNDATYGGDGIFIRSVIGACAPDNLIHGNATSFSPHNALECWCDGNAFIGNTANDSHYGIWLGGTDDGVVVGNQANRNVVDGVSIQIGENRRTLIEHNEVRDNGRAGLLLTGREIQAWHDLSYWGPAVANSSQIVVQRNTFAGNREGDVVATSTRLLAVASNCGDGGGAPRVTFGRETAVTATIGACGAGGDPPTARLAAPASAEVDRAVVLDAAGSASNTPGRALQYLWLVQPAATRFASGALPPMVRGGAGTARAEVSFPSPGAYDVAVIVHDGALAALATATITVTPAGTRIGDAASKWTLECIDAPSCVRQAIADPGLTGHGVRITTDAPYEFIAATPAVGALGVPAASVSRLGFFVRARNPNEGGWQLDSPVVVVSGGGRSARLAPATDLLPTDAAEWTYLEVPLAGGGGWTRTTSGGAPVVIDRVELHTDTWGGAPVDLWIDGLTLF